jgi:hypothetical protein
VTLAADQLSTLESICDKPQLVSEAGTDYIVLPGLKFSVAGVDQQMDVLLCPSQSGGYETRLFLAEPLPQRRSPWTSHYLCGRTWHTWSWNGVPATLSLLQILSLHLALR